ncbi:MAG: peptide deformylase [Nanoarchaeota archaeon]|nr:peptide deformylase [Nanoarchaeota archaeon]
MPIANLFEHKLILREKAKPIVNKPNLIDLKLLDILKKELSENKKLAAISPQNLLLPNFFPPYNFYKQVIVLKDFKNHDFFTLFNPTYSPIGDDIDYWSEACGSIQLGDFPLENILSRPSLINVQGINEKGEYQNFIAEMELARYIMHEIDHLNGKVISDYFSPQIYTNSHFLETFQSFIPCFIKLEKGKFIVSKYDQHNHTHQSQFHYFDYDINLALETNPVKFRLNGKNLSLELNPNDF